MGVWPSRRAEYQRIIRELTVAQRVEDYQGLPDVQAIQTLAKQFIASVRREDYYRLVQVKSIAPERADPNNALFDGERAVAFHMQQNNRDEAGWLIFLMTHFGRRPDTRWLRLQQVYGRLGAGIWDWPTVTADPAAFYRWIEGNWQRIGGAFGNHRKYESLRPTAKRPMRCAIADYLTWIGPAGHAAFYAQVVRDAGNHPHTIFDYLYKSMKVNSFGRLAKFDYLSLIGRYGLAHIEPGIAYLGGATGPMLGARLLVSGDATTVIPCDLLQRKLDALDARLGVGMRVMEDALCNWQKSPRSFVHYKG